MVRTTLYLALMAAAALVSLVRGFTVAAVLPPEEFAVYAVAVATGTLFAGILSFGLIEGTIKHFPRLVLAGGAAKLLGMADSGTRQLANRTIVGLPFLGVVLYLLDSSQPFLFFAIAAIAFGTAWLSLLASAQRAMLNAINVALANGVRAFLYLGLALLGAFYLGLNGALIGEIVAALLSALASRMIFKSTLGRQKHQPVRSSASPEPPPRPFALEAGRNVFLANSALTIPVYLDRAFVASVFGIQEAATYAVLALFASGATVLVSIVVQKVAPEIIVRAQSGTPISGLLSLAARWSAAVATAWICALVVAGWLSTTDRLAFLSEYNLTTELLIAILVLGCVQVASIFEFILLAYDRERAFLGLAIGYLALVVMISIHTALNKVSLEAFIYFLASAKVIYLLALLLTLRQGRLTKTGWKIRQ